MHCQEVIAGILDLLAKFQTLVVGVIGFTGVIITLIANAKIQRNFQTAQRKHEVRSIRTALMVELKENVRMYEDRINDLSKADGAHNALVQSKVTNNIYQSSLSNVGLLSDKEIEAVLLAYLLLEEMPYRLRLLVGTDKMGGYNNEFISIESNRQNDAKRIHEVLIPTLREAVTILERNA